MPGWPEMGFCKVPGAGAFPLYCQRVKCHAFGLGKMVPGEHAG